MQSKGKEDSRVSKPKQPGDPPNKKPPSFWLDAWHDPVASVKAYTSCIELSDLTGDGDYKLLMADERQRLRVYKGTRLMSEQALLEGASAVCAYYAEETSPMLPVLAVAAGPHVYVYRNLRPYYKYCVPPLPVDGKEEQVWTLLRENRCEAATALQMLSAAKEEGVQLTSRSLDFMALSELGEQRAYADSHKAQPLTHLTVITCMAVLRKGRDELVSVGHLVLGTEANQILILESNASTALKKVQIPSTPVFLGVAGLHDVDYRIVVACRNRSIYTIKNGVLSGLSIQLEVQPVALVLMDKFILVACMNNVIHAYQLRCKKTYSLYMGKPITSMELLHHESTDVRALLVALQGGEIRVYCKRRLVQTLDLKEPIMGIRFGRFGRESSTLIVSLASGALSVKILSRNCNLAAVGVKAVAPPEQEIPLLIPKKTKLYRDQTLRERENATEMHRIFQHELYRLRLATARAYVKIIQDMQSPISYTYGSSLQLTAQVQGMGPLFKLKLNVENTGKRTLHNMPVAFAYNHSLYTITPPLIELRMLVPGLTYQLEASVQCTSDTSAAGTVHVFVCNAEGATPIITAVVAMPQQSI